MSREYARYLRLTGALYRSDVNRLDLTEINRALRSDVGFRTYIASVLAMRGGDSLQGGLEEYLWQPEIPVPTDDFDDLRTREKEDEARDAIRKEVSSRIVADARRSIQSALFQVDDYNFALALLFKLMPAFAAGFLITLFAPARGKETAPLAAAFAAFLFAWPVILLWDQVVEVAYYRYELYFQAMYVFYVLAYYFSAQLGCTFAGVIGRRQWAKAGLVPVDWKKVATDSVATVATAALTAVVTWTFSGAA